MVIGDFEIQIKDGVIIVISHKGVKLEDLLELHSTLEISTSKTYRYGMFRSLLGYYQGYDFKLNEYIYCGSLSEKRSLENLHKYKLE